MKYRALACKPIAAAMTVAAAVAVSTQPVIADDSDRITGFWKLVSYVVVIQATGQIAPVMGDKPTGFVNFSPGASCSF